MKLFKILDVTMSFSVAGVFVFFLIAEDRSSDDPRERVRLLDFVYKIARQHHRGFGHKYDAFTLQVPEPIHTRVAASFRHSSTGGNKPKKRVNARQQREELLRTNVNRVIHKVYYQNKESFDPLP